jgi:hypothetical protein
MHHSSDNSSAGILLERYFCASARRNLSARAGNKLALAIGANTAHVRGALRAKGAFIRADRGFRIAGEHFAALFAGRFHLQTHGSPFTLPGARVPYKL